MLQINKKGLYSSSLLDEAGFPNHGFTTRKLGDMRLHAAHNALMDRLKFTHRSLVSLKQTHSDKIWDITSSKDWIGKKEADAIIYNVTKVKRITKDISQPVLTVHAADCVPILLADAPTQTLAVVHAGWRGTLRGIAKKVIAEMKKLGSEEADIVASIGPSIGPCCYDVPKERAQAFRDSYSYKEQIQERNNHWYLDLRLINFRQMRDMGLTEKHIDWHPPCTSCRNNEFFSYRKDIKESYGEMIGFITI